MKILTFLFLTIFSINSSFNICINTIKNSKKNYLSLEQNAYISINHGTIEDLITLPGIGEKTANKIIEYRNTNGLFNNKEDLMNVSGIGEAKYEAIKDLVVL